MSPYLNLIVKLGKLFTFRVVVHLLAWCLQSFFLDKNVLDESRQVASLGWNDPDRARQAGSSAGPKSSAQSRQKDFM